MHPRMVKYNAVALDWMYCSFLLGFSTSYLSGTCAWLQPVFQEPGASRLIAVDSSIRSTTRLETPSSDCTRSPDEISTIRFSTSNWPEQISGDDRRRAAAAAAWRRKGRRRKSYFPKSSSRAQHIELSTVWEFRIQYLCDPQCNCHADTVGMNTDTNGTASSASGDGGGTTMGGGGREDTTSRGLTTLCDSENTFRDSPMDNGKASSNIVPDPLGITDSTCKNQFVMVSVQYGTFSSNIPTKSTTIGKSRVARDSIAMHTSWRSNSDIACATRCRQGEVGVGVSRQVDGESRAPGSDEDVEQQEIPLRRRARQTEVDDVTRQIGEMELVLARFQSTNPPTFTCVEAGLLAEGWLEHMEELFDAVEYSQERRLKLAVLQLREHAQR
ncbi:hypothetical protein F511_36770 [Dorcoceras hygrometricum]|uniref:Uncharacterized protein n=1 Tax=Dorcoceras hygrometricum TaxID=472368 RepID=A0A2Z7B4L6_9LAMI|nr:hypothetical protein F511_36770 [Dorcoceras hygrometricum]